MAADQVHAVALTFRDQLPVLQIVVPFMTAPLIVLIGNRRVAWVIAFAASLFALANAWALMGLVSDGSYISYQIGGWAPPLGIEYRVDATNALILFLIALISSVTLPYALRSVTAELGERGQTLFYACWMLCFTGLMGMVVTGDAFNIFVFLEISSLSTYVLVASGAARDKRALTAAYNYLIMGTVGATFYVIGVGFLYVATGTLNLADLAARIAENGTSRTVEAGFAFILIGIGLKAAMVPLHLWLPNAYTYAPSAVTTFLSATATKASIYVLLRFLFSVFAPAYGYEVTALHMLFIPLALIAMFAGSIVAVFQRDFKRMLGYSSIAQIGYMLLGVSMLNATGVSATLVHMFNHGITKAALFMGVGAIVFRRGSSFYDDMAGLGRRMPVTGAVVVVGGLSLIGVPGTAGFISKWQLVQAAFENGWWPIAIAVLASSLLAVVYVWRVVEVLYMTAPAAGSTARDPGPMMLVPMLLLAAACIWFGIFTNLPLGAARTAAGELLHGSFGIAAPSGDTSALPLGGAH